VTDCHRADTDCKNESNLPIHNGANIDFIWSIFRWSINGKDHELNGTKKIRVIKHADSILDISAMHGPC